MATKYTSLTYTDNYLLREDAVEAARRLRKAYGNQHIKLIIRDDMYEDYVLMDGIAHWFMRPVFYVEILVHKESKQIPF